MKTQPRWDQAIIDDSKLSGYCLNMEHPEGRHKARVFQAVLNIGCQDAPILREELRCATVKDSPRLTQSTPYGDLYVLDFSLEHKGKVATVRSAWMVDHGQNVPRLVSCYVLKSGLS